MWLCRHRNGVGNIKPLLTPKIAFYCITKRAYRRYDDTPVLPCTLYDSYPDSVYCCYCFMSSYLKRSFLRGAYWMNRSVTLSIL